MLGEDKINKSSESNISKVMQTIKDIISRFKSQPLLHIDKDNIQILKKYPKYLTRFSLLHLQFQDYLFRETFLVQILVFIDTLNNPNNNIQKKYFLPGINDDERKNLNYIGTQIICLLSDS